MEPQLAYLAQHYPRRKGVETFAVTGEDHEGWFARREGIDIGRRAEQTMRAVGRTDWHDLGFMEAHVTLRHARSGRERTMAVVHPGGGSAYALCFDDQTEILASSGWKLFRDLDLGESVATLNRATGLIEYQQPLEYTDEAYRGEMVRFGGDMVDLVVTPNHRLWARRPWDRWSSNKSTGARAEQGYQFIEAGDVRGRDWCIPKSGTWVGERVDSVPLPPASCAGAKYDFPSLPAAPFLRLMGWYVAEGNLNHANRQVEISQNPGERQDEIAALCRELGYNPYVWGCKVRVSSIQLYEFLRDLGTSETKFVPAWIKGLTPALIWEFLEGYLRGDGCKAMRGGEMKWHSASTVSSRLADDLQELFVKVGLSATVTRHAGAVGRVINGYAVRNARDFHVVSINYEMLEPVLTAPLRIPYAGRVYCVSVPNETILVRRNGRAVFTGNSYSVQKIIEALEGGEKPAVALYGHYHKLWAGNIRNVWVACTGCTQDQTVFTRNKIKQEVHVGGLLIRMQMDPETGALIRFCPEIIRRFARGTPNGRWSKAGPAVMVERVP
jgi:uncharacterized protein (DUF433 family)